MKQAWSTRHMLQGNNRMSRAPNTLMLASPEKCEKIEPVLQVKLCAVFLHSQSSQFLYCELDACALLSQL